MTTYLVTNLDDDGAGSLRAAIVSSNSETSSPPNVIEFAVSGTITLASALPVVIKTVAIDATSSPAYSAGGPPTVEVDFNGHAGLTFGLGAGGSSLLGVALGHASGNGVTLEGSDITLNGNYIGLRANGTAFGNALDGVHVTSLSSGNDIGYNPDAASGFVANVISGNGGNGIALHGSSSNTIVSNRIGTNADGTAAIRNGENGILLTEGSTNNTIGGTAFIDTSTGEANNPTGSKGAVPPVFVVPPLGNLISGNFGNGVMIEDRSENNVLYGNFIGTIADGDAALGNGLDGVLIVDSDGNSLIGCTVVENPFIYYNVLSGNGGNGLHVTSSDDTTIQANFFGIGADNATVVANGKNGVLMDGDSQNTVMGGIIPLGNVSSGNEANGLYVTDTVSRFISFNTFGGLFAFGPAAPNGNDGILIDSTGGDILLRTNALSGNLNNGIEIAGDARGVELISNVAGLQLPGLTAIPNQNNGLLITGTAHDNLVGGISVSSPFRNSFSGNLGYGIVIAGAAYDNQLFENQVGLDTLGITSVGNVAGGILLASTGGNNLIGGYQTDPDRPRANYVSGNLGNGITLASGVSGDQIIGNFIGTDRDGSLNRPNGGQPIAINGSYANVIVGNTPFFPDNSPVPVETAIGLPPQEVMSQLEGLYIGYFGRAGDSPGVEYWMTQALTQMAQGATLQQAILGISASFAVSAENDPYSILATQPLDPQNPQQVALATAFIEQVYEQAFDRRVDAGGLQYWLDQLFSGAISYSALVYVIEFSANQPDQAVLNSKLAAGSYFTQSTAGSTPPLPVMEAAVANVFDTTSFLMSKAATDRYTGQSQDQATYAAAFEEFPVTGVRADYEGKVVLTGSQVVDGANLSALYSGPMQDTALGTIYLLTPQFSGQTITGANFYGPNTSIFTPSIGVGNVVAVGSYTYSESDVLNHGMIYRGPIAGGGTWTQIDVPSSAVGGAIVEDTIPHSTMGDLVVGNYDLQGVPASGNAFVYDMATETWTIFDQGFGGTDQLTTAYGIWQNGIDSSSYTIAGGSNHGIGINQAFLVNYDSLTGIFSDLKFYEIDNVPGAISHFEGITAIPGGFNLITQGVGGASMATVVVNPDGSFGEARWTPVGMPGATSSTGNSVYQDFVMGIYLLSGTTAVPTYTAVVDQSQVSELGGLIMPIGALDFAYSMTVQGSVGALVVGSRTQGNVLGGSIGNDTFVGTDGASMSDTIYTGGGADVVLLSDGRLEPTRIELYAGNSIDRPTTIAPGQVQTAVAHSIVDANDVPQLGWWGQATAQLGGPVSDAATNRGFGTGTSADMSVVANFLVASTSGPGDSLDLSLSAFSGLLRSANPNNGPALGDAVFSNLLVSGDTVVVPNADVLLFGDGQTFADAAALAEALVDPLTAIKFSLIQTNSVNHYMVAYDDTAGNLRIADLNIYNPAAFDRTSQVQSLAISDMVQLAGLSVVDLQQPNIQFVS